MDASAETFVIIPTYNEADNLDDLVTQVLALPVSIGVVVVDDNSPDGTGAMADALAVTYPGRVYVVHRPGKLGLGTAYLAGFKKAMDDLGARRIMTMDADFSHNPRYIPAMIEMSRFEHVVIGSRYVPGAVRKIGAGIVFCSARQPILWHVRCSVCKRTTSLPVFGSIAVKCLPPFHSTVFFPAATLSWLRCCFCANDAVGKLVRCRSFLKIGETARRKSPARRL